MEQPLSPNSACNLGSINLFPFVEQAFTENSYFNWDDFKASVRCAIRALDEVVDENLENHALKEQRDKASDFRNIGLGIMGLGDCLIALGIRYGSEEAISFCNALMYTMFHTALDESIELAKEKGVFLGYTDKVWDASILKNGFSSTLIAKGKKYGLRNCSLLSIAPTGSLATMLNGISGGCEPYFAFEYTRTTKSLNGEHDSIYTQYAPIVKKYREKHPTGPLPDYFVTSENISWKERIDMQAALQNYCDTAISSTVNLPVSTPKEDIEQLYLYAWEKGLKGITVFRSGCKRVAILSTNKSENTAASTISSNPDGDPLHTVIHTPVRKVSDDCIGKKRTLMTGCGTLHLTAFFDRHTGQLLETYFSKGSSGGCALFMVGLSRMVSLAARANISTEDIVDQLLSSGTCPSYAVRKAVKGDTSKGSCCPVAIGYALIDMYKEMQRDLECCRGIRQTSQEIINTGIQLEAPHGLTCPKCGEPINMVEGCMTCPACGYSKCG